MRWSHREDFARARTRAGLNLVANVPMTPVNLVEGVIQGFRQRHLAQRFANHDDSWRRRQHPARRRHIQEAGADDQGREVHRAQKGRQTLAAPLSIWRGTQMKQLESKISRTLPLPKLVARSITKDLHHRRPVSHRATRLELSLPSQMVANRL
jgi:hypothetical protein